MNECTPGPWVLDLSGTSPSIRAPSIGSGYFSGIGVASQRDPNPVFGGGVTMSEAIANARLFATARELLGALEKARQLIGGDLVGPEWKEACHEFMRQSREVIDKARQ